jgi:FlaA1/EpsC-like NDP-sugar epimerase
MANGNRDELLDSMIGMRNRYFFALDILAMLFVPAIALSLRLDGLSWWSEMVAALALYTCVALLVKESIFLRLRVYGRYWRYAGLGEVNVLLIAVGLSTIVLTALYIAAYPILRPLHLAMYRTVPLIDGLLTLVVVIGFRFGSRALAYAVRGHRGVADSQRVLVVGAGEAGLMAVRELRANPQLRMEAVAFVDDDVQKQRSFIEGIPVAGSCDQIPEVVQRHQIQRIIVAMPSAPFGRLQEIAAACQKTGVSTYNLPGIYQLLAGHKSVSRTPQIDITQLLRRQPVHIDETEVAASLTGARVLVTGAGGSIGRELCRQIARFNPAKIILLGHGENSIFEIDLDLGLSYPDLVRQPVIADIRDERRIDWVIENNRPDVIFHAAAHKHVPLMEASIGEAMANNVLGTRNLLAAAEQHGVERFVLISSDKAVNPTSVMGATKRLAELLVAGAARRSGRRYIAVRFGNVLGSRGSVIPVFQQQIAGGGPVTVTHPDMYRYFMTIPEAVQLVLQAAVLGRRGEVFVLDMGQPVRILDLANDLIRLSGLEPGRDIKINFTGLRPGEKLVEELFLEREDYKRTKHPRIFVASGEGTTEAPMLEQTVLELVSLTQQGRFYNGDEGMRLLLPQICQLIDSFQDEQPAPPRLPIAPEKASPGATPLHPPSLPALVGNPSFPAQ